MEGVSFNWVNEVGGWVKREKVAKTGVDERKGAKSGGQNEVGIEQESTKAELSKTKTGKKEAAGNQKRQLARGNDLPDYAPDRYRGTANERSSLRGCAASGWPPG